MLRELPVSFIWYVGSTLAPSLLATLWTGWIHPVTKSINLLHQLFGITENEWISECYQQLLSLPDLSKNQFDGWGRVLIKSLIPIPLSPQEDFHFNERTPQQQHPPPIGRCSHHHNVTIHHRSTDQILKVIHVGVLFATSEEPNIL